MPRLLLLLVALALASPLAAAQLYTVDFFVEVREGAVDVTGRSPVYATVVEPGRVDLKLALLDPYTVVEIRYAEGAFDVDRAQQVVPLWIEPGVDFPLFAPFPNERVWEAEAALRLYSFVADEPDAIRLGLAGPSTAARMGGDAPRWDPARVEAAPGATLRVLAPAGGTHTFTMEGFDAEVGDGLEVEVPSAQGEYEFRCRIHESMTGRLVVTETPNATLRLQRDVTPPAIAPGPVTDRTTISFLQEVRTDELSLVDLQRREVGTEGWVQNPTQVFHTLHRFPVQGLDADTEYEARLVARDWSGNEATSATYKVRTLPPPVVPIPDVVPISPLPNSTVGRAGIVVRASVDSPGSPVTLGDVRVFFDLQEVTPEARIEDGVLTYYAPAVAPGTYRVRVEATNALGGTGVEEWRFTVEGAPKASPTPAPGAAWAALAVVAGALVARRARSG